MQGLQLSVVRRLSGCCGPSNRHARLSCWPLPLYACWWLGTSWTLSDAPPVNRPQASTYKRVKPQHSLPPNIGPFEGESTNKLDYKHWGVPRPRTAMVQSNVATNTVPFAGQSLYAETFK